MAHVSSSRDAAHPRVLLDLVIAELGAWRVLWAAVRAMVAPGPARPRRVDARRLNDHLRRDIGLGPLGAFRGERPRLF